MRSETSALGVKKNAFSLVIAMGLVLIMTLLVLYILEYMIPYSKNVKGIENSSNAFYQAENSIEDGLLFFKNRTGFADKNTPFNSSKVAYKYNTTSSGQIIPYNLEGNSEFNTSFNTISQGNPIQLKVGNGIKIKWDDSNTKIYFNVPNLDKYELNIDTETLSGTNIINWQLSSDTNSNTLNASGSLITVSEINSFNKINLFNKKGTTLYGTGFTFNEFYTDNCEGTNSGCTLKMSIINELKLNNTEKTSVPYLEYKFELESTNNVPLRFSRIKSEGKSYGFQKHLEVKIPQQTTNEAFDFTVFQ